MTTVCFASEDPLASLGNIDDIKDAEVTIGISQMSHTTEYQANLTKAIQDIYEKNYPNVKVVVTDANADSSTQVSQVENMISLQSYISTLLMMSLAMGIVFEIPILSWLFAKLGFISADFMRRYRRHAVVIILVVAAIITPTSDVFTLLLVSLPMWLLYEVSIWIVKRSVR